MLQSSDGPLWSTYDLAMLDLDGVVYVGSEAVPGAAEHIAGARHEGMRVAFVTNNASRTPQRVADHLSELGVRASSADVVTSAQAAARVLSERLPADASVVLLGAEGLRVAVEEAGLRPVDVDADAAAVVTGYGPQVTWAEVMRVCVRVRDGLWWVASNTDGSIPTPLGLAPGHGVLVDTIRGFTGVEPVVAGKPARPLLEETVRRVGGERPLMVGDRLDTDIEGGANAGVDSLLVLTGVTGLPELVAARPQERPTYLGVDLAALGTPHPAPTGDDGGWSVAGWTAKVLGGQVEVAGDGAVDDWWRVVAAAAWSSLDDTGVVVDVAGLEPPTSE